MKKIYSVFVIFSMINLSGLATTWDVTTVDLTFQPQILNVEVGDVILWTWGGSGSHTTTSVSVPTGAATWNSALNSSTTSFSYTITTPGNYAYVCSPHVSLGMAGGFTVQTPARVEPIISTPADFSVGVESASHTIHLRISNATTSYTVLRLIDITGKNVAVLYDNELGTGDHRLHYDMSVYTPGIYFVRMEQNNKLVTRRVLLN